MLGAKSKKERDERERIKEKKPSQVFYEHVHFGLGFKSHERGMYQMVDEENVYSNLIEVTGTIFIPSSFKCVIQTRKDLSTGFPNTRIILPLGGMRESSPVFQD